MDYESTHCKYIFYEIYMSAFANNLFTYVPTSENIFTFEPYLSTRQNMHTLFTYVLTSSTRALTRMRCSQGGEISEARICGRWNLGAKSWNDDVIEVFHRH